MPEEQKKISFREGIRKLKELMNETAKKCKLNEECNKENTVEENPKEIEET